MSDILAAMDATWPPLAVHPAGAFLVREGRGGGSRVSSASLAPAALSRNDWSETDIDAAEQQQAALGQARLFMVRPGEARLDAALAERGYRVADPVVIWQMPTGAVALTAPEPLGAFSVWPPLAVLREIWLEGGIGPARMAVMDRCTMPKTAILGRTADRPSAAAFVAVHAGIAMVHALFVLPAHRRRGAALNILRHAARWSSDLGATRIAVLVTRANEAANGLYASLGMEVVGQYHYRLK